MQTDVGTISRDTLKSIVKKKPLSEEQAQILITKEKSGRGRKRMIDFLASQVRKAKRRRSLQQLQQEGTALAMV